MYRHKRQGIRKNRRWVTKNELWKATRAILGQIIDTGLIPDAHKQAVERQRSARAVK
jgi:hypothetical protein